MHPKLRQTSLALAACLGVFSVGSAQVQTFTQAAGARVDTPARCNRPPVITTSLDGVTSVPWQSIVRFTVTVTDPDGDRVDVRMLQRPGGLDFVPAVGAPSPWTRTVTWNTVTGGPAPRPSGLGPMEMVFEVKDRFSGPAGPATTRHAVRLSVEVEEESRVQIGDVTGDGVDDVVASARLADLAGSPDVGAVYVWAGGVSPSGFPTASLSVAGAVAGARLGESLDLLDVNGDGQLDIVATEPYAEVGGASAAGAIDVWFGGSGLQSSTVPDARLTVPGAVADDRLGILGLSFDDVTGDGQGDLVVRSRWATIAGQQSAGAVYVWKGGGDLQGALGPLAQLRSPNPEPGDFLSWNGFWSEGVLLEDVNADGILDLIVANPYQGDGAEFNLGKVWFWAGGASLTGVPAPTAILELASPSTNDNLGGAGFYGIRTADVTGDGLTDVIVSSPDVNLGPDGFGAVHVWPGGPGFTGTRLPSATLHASESSDPEGFASGSARLADLTGDGVLDIAVLASRATVDGVDDAGAVYIWEGGATLTGTPAPLARLNSTVLTDDGYFASGGTGLVFADLTGDSLLDIVTTAFGEDHGEDEEDEIEAGAGYVFAGGKALTGTPAPLARLTAANRWDYQALGYSDLLVSDVTGDGHLDVVVGSKAVIGHRGAIFVFEGGPSMSGERNELARLRYHDTTDEGYYFGGMFELVDLSGDGVDDIVAHRNETSGSTSEADPVFVWQGGAGLTGNPTEAIFYPSDDTGYAMNMTGWWFFRDVDADGIMDLVSGSTTQQVDGQAGAGSAYVWTGRAVLADTLPTRAYERSDPVAGDRLGEAFGRGAFFGDIDDDGLMDVLIGAASANIAGADDAGALYLWFGTAAGSPPPDASLRVQNPEPDDGLGG